MPISFSFSESRNLLERFVLPLSYPSPLPCELLSSSSFFSSAALRMPSIADIRYGISYQFCHRFLMSILSQNCYRPYVCGLCHPPDDSSALYYLCFDPRINGDLCAMPETCPDCRTYQRPSRTNNRKISESVDDPLQIADYSSNDEVIPNDFPLASNDQQISSDFQGFPSTPAIPNDFQVSSNSLPILGENTIALNDFVGDESATVGNDESNFPAKP